MTPSAYAKCALVACLCSIIGLYVCAGQRGVGFGKMWDEGYQIEGLSRSVDSTSMNPEGYYYGGTYYVPGYLLLAPSFLSHLPEILDEMRQAPSRPYEPRAYPALVAWQQAALEWVRSLDFREQERRLFVCFVALSIVWVFGAGYFATGSAWAALVAAAAVGCSWELSYHGRWIAVDSLLAQFTALVLLFVTWALSASSLARERWLLRCAALAAGCGLGSKMPGLFLIVPILIALGYSVHRHGLRAWLGGAFEAGAIMLLVFVAFVPGVVIDPLHYMNDMYRVVSDYNAISDDYVYCEPDAWLRVGKIGAYWALALFSPHSSVALVFAALAVLGAVVGVRERQPKVIATLGFLLLYAGFVANQRLLIARNLMATLPALALLIAVGVERLTGYASRVRLARAGLALALCAGLLANASWLWRSAVTVGSTTDETILRSVHAELVVRPGSKLYISEAALAALRDFDVQATLGLPQVPWDQAEEVLMYADAVPAWKANTFDFARYFGSQHANYDYYPGLLLFSGLKPAGAPMILLSKRKLIRLGIEQAPAR